MNILVLKLILAPVIIGSASLAGRRWGAAVSGWLVTVLAIGYRGEIYRS